MNTNTYGNDDSYDDMFLAKLTAVRIGTGVLANKFVYDWEEQSFDPETGLPVIMDGGRTGTYSTDGQSPAIDINNKHINTLPIYVMLKFRCVGDTESVFEFDTHVNVTNISNRIFQLGITGTPTAGTFTITITNPDATTTTTGTIAYDASFLTVLANATAALNTVLGTDYAECGGTSWATFYVRMGSTLHTLTAVNIGSLTGASGSSVSLMAAGTVQWLLSPEPLKFDNRTGIKVLNDGTVKLFPSLSDLVTPASADCSIQINTCPIPLWIAIADSEIVKSLTVQPGYTEIPGGGGIIVEYQGWCGPITAASWSSGTATVTSAGHPLTAGDIITITGVDPDGYNVSSVAVTATTSTTISYAVVSDPGTYVEGGVVSAPDTIYCVENPTDCCDEDEVSYNNLSCTGEDPCIFNYPSTIEVTFTDRTGTVIDGFYTGPILMVVDPTTHSSSWYLTSLDGFDFLHITFSLYCHPGTGLPHIQFDMATNPYYGATTTGASASGDWSNNGGGGVVLDGQRSFACNSTWTPVDETPMTVNITGGSSPNFTTTTFTVVLNVA